MREILTRVVELLRLGTPAILCTLVETRGSTPQKAGASMVVLPDGSQYGTLGGGCVEAEVKQRTLAGLADGKPALFTFHLDSDYGWDDGLICGGRMTILAQPLRSAVGPEAAYFTNFRDLVDAGLGCTDAILLEEQEGAPVGARFLLDADGRVVTSLHARTAPGRVLAQHIPPAQRPRPAVRGGVAYLPFAPRVRLLIVGAGHVGQAVGQLAAEADFDVWVLDDREAYANRERFPLAQRILVGDHGKTLAALREREITSSTYAIIVTRGHNHDEEALYYLAETPAAYIGLIGSRRKIRLIFEDLLAKGIPASALARVKAPLGLNIGSQTVPEIAVSIVAELIAFRNLGDVPQTLRNFEPITVAPP